MQELKNIYRQQKDRNGLFAELIVAIQFIFNGYRLVGHRKCVAGVEIDLIFDGPVFVEVKRNAAGWELPISKRQWIRIQRALLVYGARRVLLATVDIEANVEVFEDVLAAEIDSIS